MPVYQKTVYFTSHILKTFSNDVVTYLLLYLLYNYYSLMFSAIILSPYFWDRDFIKSLDIWRKIFILCPGFSVNWDICKKTTYYVPYKFQNRTFLTSFHPYIPLNVYKRTFLASFYLYVLFRCNSRTFGVPFRSYVLFVLNSLKQWDILLSFYLYVPSIWFLGKIFIQNSNHDLKKVQKSKEKLTSFLLETILILDQEIAEGFLTETDKKLILMLLQKSMLRISYRNRNLCQEVYNRTEPVLKLPTDELFEVIHERDALKRACSKKDSEIADRDAKLADQDAKLAEYKRRYGDL